MKRTENSHEFSRRDFNKLTMAAFGGLLAGAAVGCGGRDKPPEEQAKASPASEEPAGSDTRTQDETNEIKLTASEEILLQEPHVCRGLNACKGQGASKDNACAGQGACATAAAHECAGMNECKGQGGCSTTAGRNACKAQGECAVPLSDKAWKNARAAFEKAMKSAGKNVGQPSAKS